ncbi:helix-turn-helix domain-containing protein [Streptomyces violascens]|uniref:helix-turn-helix domain-containing protein n=1 Tax=Streptomyces violascens TaxID=67381 RepID=UPI0036894F8A
MRTTVYERGVKEEWGVARPARPSRMAGVSMAGFCGRSAGPVDAPVLPHPGVTLVVEFGSGLLVVDDAAGRQQRGSLVAGLASGAVRMRGERIECVEVRLSPLVARTVLGVSPAELDRGLLSLDDVWGDEAARIRERLNDAPSWQARFALADALLARRGGTGPRVDPEVAAAWHRIVADHGLVRIEDLAAETGWTRRRLWGRFRSQIGVPPKSAARLVRFSRAAQRLAAGLSATRVAAECGYADQSHLHREVLAFTTLTPTMLAGNPGAAANGVAWAGRAVGETA